MVVQLTSRSNLRVDDVSAIGVVRSGPGALDRDAELRREPLRFLGRPVPDLDQCSGALQRPVGGAGRAPGADTRARLPRGDSGRAAISPLASVFSASIPAAVKLSVFEAPISRAAAEARSATARAASLCGTVTLTPAKSRPGSERTSGSNSSAATSIAW